jgi:hypothetical protein
MFNQEENEAESKHEMRNVKNNNIENENKTEVNLDPPKKLKYS